MINQLIINADDFGMTEGVTIGILLAHQQGVLTSTTCMINMPFAEFALKQAQKFPQLGVGIHLVLTLGKPLIDGALSYTDENGDFKRPSSYEDGKPHADENELYREWKAQIDKFIEIAGQKPTHIDSHHHVHLLPWHHDVVKRLAKEYNIPIRQEEQIAEDLPYIPCDITFYNKKMNLEYFKELTEKYSHTLEIMCHPALLDQRLCNISSYTTLRMEELEILRSPELIEFIKSNHIELINYSHIK